MDKSSKNNLANDIENRLDDFFDDADAPTPAKIPSASLQKLKSVVLSIDWEITDACLDDLKTETDALLPSYQSDPFIHALLRMLKALGAYIRNLKARAHPDAIKRVMSTFKNLEKLVNDPQLTEEAKKQVLAKEINAFKQLKQHVLGKPHETAKPSGADTHGVASFVEHHKFEQAMSEVERRLNDQVAQLKSQLQNVQQEIDALRKG